MSSEGEQHPSSDEGILRLPPVEHLTPTDRPCWFAFWCEVELQPTFVKELMEHTRRGPWITQQR